MATNALPDAHLLAALDGVEYLQVDAPVVLAARGDQAIYYCAAADWDGSPVAQEAARIARIAALEAELAVLKAAAPPKADRRKRQPALPAPAPAVEAVEGASTDPAPPAPDAAPVCPQPGCGYVAKTPAGLAIHIARRHKDAAEDAAEEAVATPPPALAPPPIVLHAEAERFVCAQCQSTAFAPGILTPTICMRCVADSRRRAAAAAD